MNIEAIFSHGRCSQTKERTSRRAGPRRQAAGWLLPGVLLALMPKCPVCFAAYIAVASGIGLSLPTAAFLRTTLILVCVASLVFLLGRQLFRWVRN